MATVAVAGFNVAPVKSLGLQHPEEIQLEAAGVRENRRFFLTREDGRLFRGAYHGPLVRIRPEYDAASERLTLRFPDGSAVSADALGEEPASGDFWGRSVPGRVLAREVCDALSEYAGNAAADPARGRGRDRHRLARIRSPSLGDGSVSELGGGSATRSSTRAASACSSS